MHELASMNKEQLKQALSVLTDDYENWIAEQESRVGTEVVGHDRAAGVAIDGEKS